jgi:asparagine synthase (glutamine-hydrolysing)
VHPSGLDRYWTALGPYLPPRFRFQPGDKLEKLAEIIGAKNATELYFRLLSTWKHPGDLAGVEEPTHPILQASPPPLRDFLEQMMCSDGVTYLPDDILAKVDRAAMGVSLETRTPMLDPAVAAFAWTLPRRLKVRDGHGKWILREVLARYLPRSLFERPKMGFGVPLAAWLRGPLRDWAEDALDERRLRDEGYLDPAPIREKWHEHLEGRRNRHYYLWPVLMFQAWHRNELTLSGRTSRFVDNTPHDPTFSTSAT